MKIKIKSQFLNSISILASGSIIAQIITLGAAPFITRLYTPEEIGIYTFIIAISHLFMSIINGRYDMSIVTEEKEERIYPLIKLALIIAFFASSLISMGYGIYIFYFDDSYSSYIYTVIFLFLLLISYGIINVLNSYNNRNKEYKLMTSVYVIRTTSQNVGAILLGFLKIGMLGLLIPYTVGQYMGIYRQGKSLIPKFKFILRTSSKEMREVLKLHYKQPLFSVPAMFANSFSYASITFFIATLYGMSVVGFYAISVRLLGIPLAVISGNVSKVYFEEASREYNETGQFYNAFKKTALFQFLLAIPMVLCMILFAPSLFEFVFGIGWDVAGQYVAILAPMFGIRFVVTALSPGLLVAKKQNYELVLQLLFIAASVISYIITKLFSLSVEMFLLNISISYSIVFLIFFVAIFRFSKNKT